MIEQACNERSVSSINVIRSYANRRGSCSIAACSHSDGNVSSSKASITGSVVSSVARASRMYARVLESVGESLLCLPFSLTSTT